MSLRKTPGKPMAFKADGCVAIHVPDLKRAAAFYGDVLGFKLIAKAKGQLVYKTGKLVLYVNLDKQTIPFIPALQVEDFKKAKALLKKSGCTIIREFAGSKALYFTDPFGIMFDIIEA